MRALIALLAFLFAAPVYAQQASQLSTLNQSIAVATGGTYQTVSSGTTAMASLTVQNNNYTSSDYCFIEISGLVTSGMTTASAVTPQGKAATTAVKVSITLAPGQGYARYYPHLPKGPIVATCATTGDTLYVDWQYQ